MLIRYDVACRGALVDAIIEYLVESVEAPLVVAANSVPDDSCTLQSAAQRKHVLDLLPYSPMHFRCFCTPHKTFFHSSTFFSLEQFHVQ